MSDSLVHVNLAVQINYYAMHCTCSIKIVTICVQTLRRRYMSQEIPDPQHALGTQMGTRVTHTHTHTHTKFGR